MKREKTLFIVITLITGIVSAFAMYNVLSSRFLMGWDTPYYVYMSQILEQYGVGSFLEKTSYGFQGLLYYLIVSGLQILTGQSLFFLEKLVPSLLFGALFMASAIIVHVWTQKTHLALICLVFAVAWPAPYILASNFFSNLLGFLFILLAIAFVPDGFFVSTKSFLLAIILMLMASLSHPLSSTYFVLVIAVSLFSKIIADRHRRILFLKLALLLVASLAGPLFTVVMTKQVGPLGQLLNSSQSQNSAIRTVDIIWGLELIGYTLLPLIILSILLMLNRIVKEHKAPSYDRELVGYSIVCTWAISTISLFILSYFVPIEGSFVERLLILFPSPFILAFGFSRIWGYLTSRKIKLTPTKKYRNVIFGAVLLSIMVTPNIILVAQDPHIRGMYYSWVGDDIIRKMSWVSAHLSNPNSPLIFVVDHNGTDFPGFVQYWRNVIGAFVPNSLVYIGKIDSLLMFNVSQFSNPLLQAYAEGYWNELLELVKSPENLTSFTIVIVDNFYYPIAQFELTNRLVFLAYGVYIVNMTSYHADSDYL